MATSNEYSRSNVSLLRITTLMYKALGLAPFSFKSSIVIRNSKTQHSVKFIRSNSARAYGLIGYLTVIPFEFYYFWIRYNEEFKNMSYMQNCFDIFFAFTVQFTQMMIILLFNIRQKRIVNILNKLLRFESEIVEKLNDVSMYYSGIYDQILIFIGFMFIGVAHILSEYLRWENDCVMNIVMYIFPELVIRSFTIQCAMMLMFIRKKYKILNEALLLHSDSKLKFKCHHSFFQVLDISDIEITLKRVALVRKAYSNLNTILSEISQFYSLLICIAIGYYCFEIVYSAYSLTLEFKKDVISNFFECFNWSLILLACIYPTVVLTNYVTSVNMEVRILNFE
ncbi:hypothetical protein G9C98_003743 [Cotesia typhae]|uniref:Gustatory receptor n=1 Tax=Cotesia typhae TaxID=2053667 RepID=A0A8J5UXW0_9HYME|nr:hypothetical protein G9C98_003743 [Cotesia typhae]